jgi:exo-beta-1,3-glucanase (GH17 family)
MTILKIFKFVCIGMVSLILTVSCQFPGGEAKSKTASEILGNPAYPAISYGGYRNSDRSKAPSVEDIKEDVLILHAAGFRILRTYHARLNDHTSNLLQAINELKAEDSDFEMYVMMGAWIQCENAWTDAANHNRGDTANNKAEIDQAVTMANTYPDIVKVIAVGNESMVHWASGYFVQPAIVLDWVNMLQAKKKAKELPSELWITSSDNFASWGGGSKEYHSEELQALINSVDYLSVHTYPFHDTHYNPDFWPVPEEEEALSKEDRIAAAMNRALLYAQNQYNSVKSYMKSINVEKPIHIGETGWASLSDGYYGTGGSRASDELKQSLYYHGMRKWSDSLEVACFFFEALDEPWKDGNNPNGSENHFGLFTAEGKAKYAVWDLVDKGTFEGLGRTKKVVEKTFDGDKKQMMGRVFSPPVKRNMKFTELKTTNRERQIGETVKENVYRVLPGSKDVSLTENSTYPSAVLKLNVWDGTCGMEGNADGTIKINTGNGDWWGCALEIQSNGQGENLSEYNSGTLHFEIKGNTTASFDLGLQTGVYANGTQVNNSVRFGAALKYKLESDWKSYHIPISELNKGADLANVTGVFYALGNSGCDGKTIELRNIYYSKK